ncbi:MAG: adenylate/guanylate cyclase domain-containing protein [Deltaproteobacteria bacterium]|nr:adenylate/guanylate cyclase domain-containing protein [Deltaproteobacteria bacterium]MBW2086547.1 adenylate/guanylate cyclase domain-containing protein [Deltaproteobacteria bacterium]
MPVRLSPGKKKFIQSLFLCLGGTALALILWTMGWFDSWEAKTWDWRVSMLAKPGQATDEIRLILLDQNSLDWAKNTHGLSWPWPRETYSAITNYCHRSGAKALAFDVIFSEPSKYGVEDDASFGAAISEFGRFAASVHLGRTTGSETSWPPHLASPKFKIIGLESWLVRTEARGITLPRASMPIPEVSRNAAVLCNVHARPDPDGIFRRVRLFGTFDGQVLPYLGLGAYLAANPDAPMRIEPGRLTIGQRSIPIDNQGDVILRFRGPSGTHKAYSAAAVLQSEIRVLAGLEPVIRDKAAFKDKYILFGFSAPGLYDLRPTPVSGVYPGVEIHVTLLDNFLSGDFMRHVPPWLTIGLVIISALTCSLLATYFSLPFQSIIIGLVVFSLPVLLSIGLYIKGFWLSLVILELAVFTTYASALMANYAIEGQQRRFIKSAFRQYLSPMVIEQLIQNPQKLELGGERKVLSIFFSDIADFTTMSEDMTAENLTMLLNDYLSAMTDIIHAHGGTLDKYEGDAIIAFWNAPLDVPEHAVKAVRASLFCQSKLAEIRPIYRERTGWDMFMRIGVNTGVAVVGNMGSHTRFDYTMFGDAVNLASRLEGINKEFGTYTVISQSTRDLLGEEFMVRELARVVVIGRRESVTIYEPMLHEAYEWRKEVLAAFAHGLDLFYQGRFEEAIEVFSAIEHRDPPAAAYIKKCEALMASPPEDWQGLWVVITK